MINQNKQKQIKNFYRIKTAFYFKLISPCEADISIVDDESFVLPATPIHIPLQHYNSFLCRL